MKIEIDFEKKEIKAIGEVSLGELVDKLKELKLDWKEFKIISDVYTYYNPYVPQIYPIQTFPFYDLDKSPSFEPYKVTCLDTNAKTTSYSINN